MGESPKITDPLEALEAARAVFEAADDFTVGVEEEFAILDPATLDMTAGFERIDEAARTGPLAGMVAGELIRSEVEVRTGRCETFAEAADAMAHRRLDVIEVAERLGYALAAAGTHPFARWQDQEVINTQHYHLVESTLRYVAWRNNTFGIHVHTGIRGADRAVAVSSALRSVLPELLAASCSSPWLEDRHTHLHSTRTQVFTKFFPRCGIPDSLAGWGEYAEFVRFLIATRSIREHTEIWWSVRPHQAFPTVEVRICDAQPEFGACRGARGPDDRPHRSLRARVRGGPAAARAPAPPDRGELLAGDPVGMSGELIDLDSGAVMPAKARIEALVEEVSEIASELGIAPYLEVLREPTAAEVYAARLEEGESVREVWPQVVARTRESVVEWLAVREGERR